MRAFDYSPGPVAERRQLLVLGVGLLMIATGLSWFAQATVVPAVLGVLALLVLLGRLAYDTVGRAMFLLFALVASFIGRVVSAVVVAFVYFWAILVFGAILRLFGMNKLERNFARCRLRESMLRDAPTTDPESFRRQS